MAYGLSSCNSPGSREEAQYLWHTGLVVPQQVGSSQTRDQTRVSCIAGGFFTTEPPGKLMLIKLVTDLMTISNFSG